MGLTNFIFEISPKKSKDRIFRKNGEKTNFDPFLFIYEFLP